MTRVSTEGKVQMPREWQGLGQNGAFMPVADSGAQRQTIAAVLESGADGSIASGYSGKATSWDVHVKFSK